MSCIAAVKKWLQQTLPSTFPIAIWVLPIIIFLGIKMASEDVSAPKEGTCFSFEYFKNLYRERRDAFRENLDANEELKHWKARDNGYKYKEL